MTLLNCRTSGANRYGHALQRIADPDAVADEDFPRALRSLIIGTGATM
ncbi:hypothetical protein [Haloechinothrix salitolerans]|uniref:Uncharacterized protein n=1 Tax=Haloechinothrix salitolerans TaxID=926830 RepID=A0ABW2C2G5_9PSEU